MSPNNVKRLLAALRPAEAGKPKRRHSTVNARRWAWSPPVEREVIFHKCVLTGTWSREITREHRRVYRVSEERVDFLQARYHH